ncbi:MAG TPA: hypothetical protein PKD53_20945 [Chloroflexaceae bacterium]|nr:hypothetical protein [Chloroflexaceae bacterium]
MWIWTLLTAFVVLFELWYAAAFLYAYGQLRERLLLLPVAQAMLMLAAFAYLTAAVLNGWPINPFVVLGLLIGAMLVSLYWRRAPGGLPVLLRSYPRGTLDVLSFRRPAVDLKRRVRTK